MGRFRLRKDLGGLGLGLIYLGVAIAFLKFLSFEQYLYNVALVFILIVLVIASQFGVWSGIVISILGFLALDYFFIPPFYTFTIDSSAGVVAVLGFGLAAILTSQIAAQARSKAALAQTSQQETTVLNELNQAVLSEAQSDSMLARVVEQVARHLHTTQTALYLPDTNGVITLKIAQPPEGDLTDSKLARQVFQTGQALYQEDNPAGKLAYLPLQRSGETLGVLSVVIPNQLPGQAPVAEPPTSRWLTTIANGVALAVEHARLVQTTAQIESLREADQLKSALLASVSHELRTPLTSIKNAIAGLKDDEIKLEPVEQAEYLDVIDQEADRLSRLISNLLDLSRLETGTLKTKKGLYFLPEIVSQTLERLQRSHTLQNHPVNTRYEPDLPLVPVDYLQIEQVITNLVENAAKYSRPGLPISIKVSQALQPFGAVNQPKLKGILVEVTDDGIGIPDGELERIFDKFYRLEYRSNKGTGWQTKGTGLGLAISKGIIENHAGAIWARQRSYGGSVFSFWLPLSDTTQPSLSASSTETLVKVGDQPNLKG